MILGGEFLELSEEGIVVVDMSYRKKADIHVAGSKAGKGSRALLFPYPGRVGVFCQVPRQVYGQRPRRVC